MTSRQNPNRLKTQLTHMLALETAIEQRLEELTPEVSDHAEATALLTGFHTLSRDHRRALETRLNALTGNELPSSESVAIYASTKPPEGAVYPVSSFLQEIYTLYNQAVIGYVTLGSLSTRASDSPWNGNEGTSGHLAGQHMKSYVGAIQEISRLINDVVLWELDRDGLECQCTCPSCGVGVCLCSAGWRFNLSRAWAEAGPIANEEGIYVQHPKQDSAATQAGLARGDVIMAVEGDRIESVWDMQNAVSNSQPGEEIRLTVRRDSGELEDIALVHP
jgi:hypothetical protein